MSHPRESEKVKLISSIFSPEESLIDKVISHMVNTLGPTDWLSPPLYFDRTRYYEKEMGWPLFRRFVAFEQLIQPDHIVQIKLETNGFEHLYENSGKRSVNIDPGYISLERLVLATGKNYTHRIYLSYGIFADLTLVYQKGSFQPLVWTFKDYADREVIQWFNVLRERYKGQLRGFGESRNA